VEELGLGARSLAHFKGVEGHAGALGLD